MDNNNNTIMKGPPLSNAISTKASFLKN